MGVPTHFVLAYESTSFWSFPAGANATRNQRRLVLLPNSDGLLLILVIQPSSVEMSTPWTSIAYTSVRTALGDFASVKRLLSGGGEQDLAYETTHWMKRQPAEPVFHYQMHPSGTKDSTKAFTLVASLHYPANSARVDVQST